MELPRIMIAAASSGSGKTTITCGILGIWKQMGLNPCAFKCGPDYIDPMFHKKILSTPSKNLDTFFTGKELTRSLMAEGAKGAGIAVAEGVMGYYDGAGIASETASSYELAKVTETPVILVVNARGMALSAAAVIKGFLGYKSDAGIKGVILNQTSKETYRVLKEAIERECNVPVAGYVPTLASGLLKSRHLGLVMPGEIPGIKAEMKKLSSLLRETLDIEKILAIAQEAPSLKAEPLHSMPVAAEERIRVGVALDEAFCFYYDDNLKLLERLGAELVFFSPLCDRALPQGISGCIIGGGYPELHLEELSANQTMLRSVYRAFVEEKMPYMAECGGFLYLHDRMEDTGHKKYRMAGVIKADAVYREKLQRFGYITLSSEQMSVKAHEFHYYDSTDNGNAFTATKPFRDISYPCMHKTEDSVAGFPHVYYYSNIWYAREFLEKCMKFKSR